MAFQATVLGHKNVPHDDEMQKIGLLNILRMAGPTAPYPNMTFELTNLSGIVQLTNLEIVVVVNHQLKSLKVLAFLTKIKNLFVFNNQIANLEGVENLSQLEQFYCHVNQINSLKPLQNLKNIKEVYANYNELTSLDGLTKHHSDTLKTFFCLPNDKLPHKEIIRVEHKLGIKCRG